MNTDRRHDIISKEEIRLVVGTSKITIGPTGIELSVGANTLKLDPTGIFLNGLITDVRGKMAANVQAPVTNVLGDVTTNVNGLVTNILSNGPLVLKGAAAGMTY